jgi:hypothetical protein
MFNLTHQKTSSWIQLGYNKMYGGYEGHIALFSIGFSTSFTLEVISWNFFVWKWNLYFYINSIAKSGEIFTIFYKHDDKNKKQLL